MQTEIEWGNPPPDGRRSGETIAFVEALKSRPGEWAKYPTAVTRQMAQQNRTKFPGTEWTTRQRDDGKNDLYGRWVGNGVGHE